MRDGSRSDGEGNPGGLLLRPVRALVTTERLTMDNEPMTPHSHTRSADLHCITRYLTRRWAALFVALSVATLAVADDSGYKVMKPRAGGLSASPDLTSLTLTNVNQAAITWNGFAGPYQVEGSTNLTTDPWHAIGSATSLKALTLSNLTSVQFLRIHGGAPPYMGADACADCHDQKYADWSQTLHAAAFGTLKSINQDKNSSCVVCHSVGFGYSTGFTNETLTPQLSNVQCENCHGPAGNHINDTSNLPLRPVRTKSAMLCGGCHGGEYHPNFDEWETSPHGEVVPDVAANFLDPNLTNAQARMKSCGACHSGATRLAMVEWGQTGTLTLPSGTEAAETAVTCVVCHDPHKPNLDGTHSLRHPLYSTNFFSYSTSTSTTFTNQYNVNIQMCAQCHNQRGALATDTSRPPHHACQYNMLIGDIGVALGNVPAAPEQSSHRDIQKQCAHCHVHADSTATPVTSGHSFQADLKACETCHSSTNSPPNAADVMMASTQADIKSRVAELKSLLDTWATTKAPDVIRTKYGALAWEYSTPGSLSNPSASTSIVGPTTSEQANVPLDVKKARMYLYIVQYDGSFGVHNARYARFLLDTGKANVNNLLNAP